MELLILFVLVAVAFYLTDTYVIPDGPFKVPFRAICVLVLVIWLLTQGPGLIHGLVGRG